MVRATTGRGLTFDETITIEIGATAGAPTATPGSATRDVLLGTDGDDAFFAVAAEDIGG